MAFLNEWREMAAFQPHFYRFQMPEDGDESSDSGAGYASTNGGNQPLTRIDYREELDLSGRSLSYTAGLASTYVALTSLDISNNAVAKLDSMPPMLTHLNASHNLLRRISGLELNYDLQTLNLAHNTISRISGLDQCTALVELSLQSNELRVVSDLECNLDLERVDLSFNGIPAVDALRTLSLNTKVTWMCLKGNPCASNINYRHKLTGMLPGLVMLDDTRMPKNGYRPPSPSLRPQAESSSAARRAASPKPSPAAKGIARAYSENGASSVSNSIDRGTAGGWNSASFVGASTIHLGASALGTVKSTSA